MSVISIHISPSEQSARSNWPCHLPCLVSKEEVWGYKEEEYKYLMPLPILSAGLASTHPSRPNQGSTSPPPGGVPPLPGRGDLTVYAALLSHGSLPSIVQSLVTWVGQGHSWPNLYIRLQEKFGCCQVSSTPKFQCCWERGCVAPKVRNSQGAGGLIPEHYTSGAMKPY